MIAKRLTLILSFLVGEQKTVTDTEAASSLLVLLACLKQEAEVLSALSLSPGAALTQEIQSSSPAGSLFSFSTASLLSHFTLSLNKAGHWHKTVISPPPPPATHLMSIKHN